MLSRDVPAGFTVLSSVSNPIIASPELENSIGAVSRHRNCPVVTLGLQLLASPGFHWGTLDFTRFQNNPMIRAPGPSCIPVYLGLQE